ncbi:MAG: DUF2911 domain-containing protein [Gemmatimonadaceae bacterium]
MKPTLIVLIALAACSPSAPAEHYGFIARLGNDTVSVESVTRRGNTVESDEVDRFPRVRIRHTKLTLADDGSIRHLEMRITTPSEPGNQRERVVTADVGGGKVHLVKRDSTGEVARDFNTGAFITMAHLPQMYSLIDLYFQAALRRAAATNLKLGDSVEVHQFYIDREFDKFPSHRGFVRTVAPGKAEIHHDWLAGTADATLDSLHRLLTYSGQRTTYKVEVSRLTESPDVSAVGTRFAAQESSTGMHQLSVRDTVRASIGDAKFVIDYSRPLARNRTLLGGVIDYDFVWRTGANAATQFWTDKPIIIAGIHVPAGAYTLWTNPRKSGVELIVNKETGQWGTGYNYTFDLGKGPLTSETNSSTVEKFTISIVATDARHGRMTLEWGTFRWTAPIVVEPDR